MGTQACWAEARQVFPLGRSWWHVGALWCPVIMSQHNLGQPPWELWVVGAVDTGRGVDLGSWSGQ